MRDPVEMRRLRWRCRRGMRELDTLLVRFLDARYEAAPDTEQAAFRDLLALPDPEILGLLTGRLTSDDPALVCVVSQVVGQRVP
jgi:antitoxin CptB